MLILGDKQFNVFFFTIFANRISVSALMPNLNL
jgi:hypothetical protein